MTCLQLHRPWRTAVLIALALLVPIGGLVPSARGAAPSDACSLLAAGDLVPLVGANPARSATPGGQGCRWTGARPKHEVHVLTYANLGVPPEAAFEGARRGLGASTGGKVALEAGIGDRAFSGTTSFGAVIVLLKGGRVLQLQYHTGAAGTPRDVEALRPVARKAAASH